MLSDPSSNETVAKNMLYAAGFFIISTCGGSQLFLLQLHLVMAMSFMCPSGSVVDLELKLSDVESRPQPGSNPECRGPHIL